MQSSFFISARYCFIITSIIFVLLFITLMDENSISKSFRSETVLASNGKSVVDIVQRSIPNVFRGNSDVSSMFNRNDTKANKKWIVVTSVNSPTEDIKRLSELPDWSIVVVADTKTPKDWKLKGVHFLSVDDQTNSGLQLPENLPFKTYTRKNVGYLYAIKHGAEWIYDTDDDNKPYGLGLKQFDYEETVSGLRYAPKQNSNISEKLFNPYRFFGNTDMWPRGFPLEYLSSHTNGIDRMISCREMRTAVVQQGLVHKDPDVDAIYRLLKASPTDGLNLSFNQFTPPIVLEHGTYSPWNSQNTLFNYRAFFTLFLPTTVEFRVTDIWRSYFSQKLLHLIGENIAFYPVNAIQMRNAHDYLDDFEDEKAVYLKSGKIVDFLNVWRCDNETIQLCTLELAKAFRNHDFIKAADVELIEFWIKDLTTIGYKFPKLSIGRDYQSEKETSNSHNCRRANLATRNDIPVNGSDAARSRAEEKIDNFGELLEWCDAANKKKNGTTSPTMSPEKVLPTSDNNTSGHVNMTVSNSFPTPQKLSLLHSLRPEFNDKLRTVLIIVNNWPWKQSIGLLQRLYQPYFAYTIFCGTWDEKEYNFNEKNPKILSPFNFVNLSKEEMTGGYFGYYCLSKVRDLRLQNIDGYFVTADDAIFNFWVNTPLDIVVSPMGTNPGPSTEMWWNIPYLGKNSSAKIPNLVKQKYATNPRVISAWNRYSTHLKNTGSNLTIEEVFATFTGKTGTDFYYIPTKDLQYVSDWFEIFFEVRLFLELAFSKMLLGVEHKTWPQHNYLWAERDKWDKVYNSTILMQHPVKFSSFENNMGDRKRFCGSVVSTFHKMLFE